MNNLLLTGASGFVGDYFLSKYSKSYNITTFSFQQSSLDLLELGNIEVIVHLSALVHQMGGASKEAYERVNVEQTLELAKRAKKSSVKHFIFMSSVKVYGEESQEVYSESTLCHPKDEYGRSKLKAEIELQKLEDSEFKVSIIRTPIVYGYEVKANIKNLIALVDKVKILPFGDINNKRSMVYIGNLCHLIDRLVIANRSGIYLANDDVTLSTFSFISMIADELKKNVLIVKIPFFSKLLKTIKPSFYKRLYMSLEVDNTHTKEVLKMNNLYTIEEGIHNMIHGELV